MFEQSFPKGVKGTSLMPSSPYSARDDVSSAFPSFGPPAASGPALGYLAFAGDMTGSGFKHGRYDA
eukprot:SAG22_NODE_5819_length_947_cov_1.515330_1_plen_65_part_10